MTKSKNTEKLYAIVRNSNKFLIKEKQSNYNFKIRPFVEGSSGALVKSFKLEDAILAIEWLDHQPGPTTIQTSLPSSPKKPKKKAFVEEVPISEKKVDTSDLTTGQVKALELMSSGENVFLTGVAGSGKSYLIDRFAQYNKINNKNLILLATTGIAAVNISGMTIHRFLKWKGESFVFKKPKVIKLLREADTVLIEEISMCSVDLFDYFCECLKKSNEARRKVGKKDTQLIVVGDFCQLPPVITSADEEILRLKYSQDIIDKGAYCFLSDSWKRANFKLFKLNEVVRQQDKEFSDILDRLRLGDTTAIDWINTHSNKDPVNGIELSSWKNVVASINSKRLNELKTKSMFYNALVDADFPSNIYPTEERLELKVGCRVMSLVNDAGMKYQNGSLGTVLEANLDEVIVQFDNGNKVLITPHTWNNNRYYLETSVNFKGVETHTVRTEVVGSFSQIPLKLAYATTIHKSQGKTFDKMILNPQSFADGQLYVALSRVCDVNGLFLREPIKPEWLKTNSTVLEFEKTLEISP